MNIQLFNYSTMNIHIYSDVYIHNIFTTHSIDSRVGMVFLEPKNLGWKPLVIMYLQSEQLAQVLHPDCIQLVQLWLEWLIPPLLFFLTRDCVMPVVIDELQLITSLLRIFQCFLEDHVSRDSGKSFVRDFV